MRVVKQSAEVLAVTPNIGQVIELGARNCYKSEDKITEGSDERLFNQIVKQHHHDSVTEHGVITCRLVTDRAIMAQITRHRMASYSIASMRYCNYTKDKFGNGVTFIKPVGIEEGTDAYNLWNQAMEDAEKAYIALIDAGQKPETARAVLPQSTQTEIVMTANVRSWRNFFSLRTAKHAQADIRELTYLIHDAMKDAGVPMYLFEDVINKK